MRRGGFLTGGPCARRCSPFRSAVPLWNPDRNGFLKRGLEDLLCCTEGKVVHDEGFIGLPECCGDEEADWIRKVLLSKLHRQLLVNFTRRD